jgi:hypothetical protein
MMFLLDDDEMRERRKALTLRALRKGAMVAMGPVAL